MSFSLNEIFEQSKSDRFSVNVNAHPFEGRLLYGVKIVSYYRIKEKTNEITILNTQKGGAFYEEVSPSEYDSFKIFGWVRGVYILSLSNCILKMDKLKDTLEFEETKEPRSARYIEGVENQIAKTKALHLHITNKTNQLKPINYDTSQK
jgi:hypothetical protein